MARRVWSSTWLRPGSRILSLGPERDPNSNHIDCWWRSAKYSKENQGKCASRQITNAHALLLGYYPWLWLLLSSIWEWLWDLSPEIVTYIPNSLLDNSPWVHCKRLKVNVSEGEPISPHPSPSQIYVSSFFPIPTHHHCPPQFFMLKIWDMAWLPFPTPFLLSDALSSLPPS